MNYTVTYTSSSAVDKDIKSWEEVNKNWKDVKLNNKDKPPRAGYLKEDDFFEILINSYKGTYSYDGYHHPGDLYTNVLSVLEIVCNTLSAQVDLEVGRPIRNVKEI